MELQERLALALVFDVLGRLLRLGNRQPRPCRELPNGLGKRHFLEQLDELDDVSAQPAPEAMKVAAILVNDERRRFLPVKRTQPLPRRPAAAERHTLLDDLHDAHVRLQIVNERRGEQGHLVIED